MNLDEAIGNGRRTVIVFSPPALCQTATCGPLLDMVKCEAVDHPEADFVRVEMYINLTGSNFAPIPDNLAPVLLGELWNLPAEPWVFVVDSEEIVQARLEGVMAAEELADEF